MTAQTNPLPARTGNLRRRLSWRMHKAMGLFRGAVVIWFPAGHSETFGKWIDEVRELERNLGSARDMLIENDARTFGRHPITGKDVAPWTADDCYTWELKVRAFVRALALADELPIADEQATAENLAEACRLIERGIASEDGLEGEDGSAFLHKVGFWARPGDDDGKAT
jgi:hypothetical protein